MQFDQSKFNTFILGEDIIGFPKTPILLQSGRRSPWYMDWRKITDDVFLLDRLTDYLISFVATRGLEPTCFYGVPEGATKIALIAQYKWARAQPDFRQGNYVMAMGRGRRKDHGKQEDQMYIGIPRGKTIVCEDVTTTGESLLQAIDSLHKIGTEIIAAIVLTDRNELYEGRNVNDMLQDAGIPYYAMSHALDLLPVAYQKIQPDKSVRLALEAYFDQYGVRKPKFD